MSAGAKSNEEFLRGNVTCSAVSGGEALRDDPNNGCGGDYVTWGRATKKDRGTGFLMFCLREK